MVLGNARHERFAHLLAGGMTATKAYVAAGFAGKGAPQSASRLARRPSVTARIAELRSTMSCSAVAQAAIDRTWVLAGLRTMAEGATSEAVRVRAYELCGKELGMFRDPGPFEWDGDFSKLTDRQLEKVRVSLEQIVSQESSTAPAIEVTSEVVAVSPGG